MKACVNLPSFCCLLKNDFIIGKKAVIVIIKKKSDLEKMQTSFYIDRF